MGGQGGCERIIEVFVKIQKKKNWGGGGGAGGSRGGGGSRGVGLGQGGVGLEGVGFWVDCERRIEVFEKIHWRGGQVGGRVGGGEVRVDVNPIFG